MTATAPTRHALGEPDTFNQRLLIVVIHEDVVAGLGYFLEDFGGCARFFFIFGLLLLGLSFTVGLLTRFLEFERGLDLTNGLGQALLTDTAWIEGV